MTFDYTYTGNHRYYQAEAEFSTVYSGLGLAVVDSPTSGSFNFSGSASLIAIAGDSFGFRIGGKNFDSSSHIDGTLTISNITFHDSLVVDSSDDELDFDLSLGNLSLREAVYIANIIPGADKITIAPSLSGQTISLELGELEITESLTIDASDLAEPLTIDGQQLSRVLNFSALSGDLTLAGLTITGGKTILDREYGGGIRFFSSYGTLTLTQCIVSGNSTSGAYAYGGGIFSYGDVTLTQSTVSGNSTTGDESGGGGISALGQVTLTQSTVSGNSTSGYQSSGGGLFAVKLTLTQSTVSGNSTVGAMSYGGGIYAGGAVTLTQSTVTDNRATGYSSGGGGVVQVSGFFAYALTIENSIVAGNIADIGPDLIPASGAPTTIRFSIIGDNDSSGLMPSPTPTATLSARTLFPSIRDWGRWPTTADRP